MHEPFGGNFLRRNKQASDKPVLFITRDQRTLPGRRAECAEDPSRPTFVGRDERGLHSFIQSPQVFSLLAYDILSSYFSVFAHLAH